MLSVDAIKYILGYDGVVLCTFILLLQLAVLPHIVVVFHVVYLMLGVSSRNFLHYICFSLQSLAVGQCSIQFESPAVKLNDVEAPQGRLALFSALTAIVVE